MALLIYNLTPAPLILPNGRRTVIPSNAPGTPQQGNPWRVSGNEIKGLTPAQFDALEQQRLSGATDYRWESLPEYPTPGLTVKSPFDVPATTQTYGVESLTTVFGEPAEGESGLERNIEMLHPSPYPFRVLKVFATVSRGAPGAQIYLCAHPFTLDGLLLGSHVPFSDRFDASQPGVLTEQASVQDRIVNADYDIHAYCSTDYVRGSITLMYQRIS